MQTICIRKRGTGIENIKIYGKKDIYKLVYDFPERHEPDEAMVLRLNSGFSGSFMPAEITRNVFSSRLTVQLSGYCFLTQYLPMLPLKKHHFLHIVNGIIKGFEEAEAMGFSFGQILTDPSYVLVRPSDLSIKFILIPDLLFCQEYHPGSLLRSVAERTVFSGDTDISFLDTYVRLTYDRENCLKKIKNFTEAIAKGISSCEDTLKRCPVCGAVRLADNTCVCGYNTMSQQDRKQNGVFLEHCPDGRIIPVNIFPFIMGRVNGTGSFCTRSTVVSRLHAELTHENSDYYISDKNSTNGTFINNRKIPSSVKIQLKDSDIFTLGDESFIFFVK